MAKANRLYATRFFAAMIAYAVLLIASQMLIVRVGDSPARYPLALLPVVPVAFGMWAFIAFLRRMDELQRKLQLEAFGFSLAMTGLVTFALGFLEGAGFPRLEMIWVLPMIIFFWGIGGAIAGRRYS